MNLPCVACSLHKCRHARVWIGPFQICRCLSCPVLVVAVRYAHPETV